MDGIRRIGNWPDARRLTASIGGDINKANLIVLKRVGLKAERLIVKWIKSQPATWPPLGEKYVSWKMKKGYSNLTLVKTSSMLQNITNVVNFPMVFIGVQKTKIYKGGESIANIAAVMEFGSKKRNIPPRPFLLPVQKLMLRLILEQDLFGRYLMQYLHTKYMFNGRV